MKNLLGLAFGLLLTLNVSAQNADFMPPDMIADMMPPNVMNTEETRPMPPMMEREMKKMQMPEDTDEMEMHEKMENKHPYMKNKMRHMKEEYTNMPIWKKALCMLAHGTLVLLFLALATFIIRKSWDCAGKKK